MAIAPSALLWASAPAAADHVSARAGPPSTASTPFCQRDFSAIEAEQADIDELQAAGGLVYLLGRNQAMAPFRCAAFYLAHGLDVNAVGPGGLTALHYAIKANSPAMVRFVITHGADLHKKAGTKGLEPMGYAYYLALKNPAINRNQIIAILNDALIAQ